MKKQNGITLIALVITIVVLLILAAVSINAILGENGILGRATESQTKTNKAKVAEYVQNAMNAILADALVGEDGANTTTWLTGAGSTRFGEELQKQSTVTGSTIAKADYDHKKFKGTIGATTGDGIEGYKYWISIEGAVYVAKTDGEEIKVGETTYTYATFLEN